MMSSWFGPRWRSLDPLLRPTYLPVFWAELASQAKKAQLQQFKPLLRARAAQRALEVHALPAAGLLALAAIGCLCAAVVLSSDGSEGSGEGGSSEGKEAQAAEAGAAWEGAGGSGGEQQLQEPLLESHPVEAPPAEPEAPTAGPGATAEPKSQQAAVCTVQ
jgi:hypothetical protein